ncbi:MAG: hypothetical protein HY053_02330 [Proteobacteria bacterium]|nr:hypothetical protein [Pseudomonadota bacterium]
MGSVNTTRVIMGGIAAGILIYFFEGLVHMGLLHHDWEAWKTSVGAVIHGPAKDISMALWFVYSIISGLLGLWIYAGIRPRYGAGPRTAIYAGFLLWAATHFTAALDAFAMGVIPHKIVVTELACMALLMPVAILVGAYLYKE